MNTKLNVKQWAIAWLAVFVIMTIFALLINKVLLPTPDAATQATFRDDWTSRILVYLSRIIMAGLFTYIFAKTYGDKPGLGHGLRYGIGIGMLLYIPDYITGLAGAGYAFFGWTASSMTTFLLWGLVQAVVCGLATAQLYKPTKA